MKTYAALAIGMLVLALAPTLHAQQCYTPVTGWQGSYNLNTSATAACTGPLENSGTCTYSQGAIAVPNFSPGGGCAPLNWNSPTDSITSASMSDTGVWPCPGSGTLTETWVGNSGFSSSSLTIDPSQGNYTYYPQPFASVTATFSGCTNGSGPLTPPLSPGSNWPQTFTLPTTVQTLTVDNFSFQALNVFPNAPFVQIPWTFSLTLGPKYNDDDDCKEDGDQGVPGDQEVPVSSSVGCQNQSLGEDVPIVGTGFHLHYESDRAPGAGGDSFASADAFMIGGWTLNVHHAYDYFSNTLFLGNGRQRNGYQLGSPVPFNGNFLLASEDGSEIYVLGGSTAQHLQTLRPLTGALAYQFGYDSAGNLVSVTDGSGNVTTIQRNGSEQATAIVSPFGQTTTLSLDSNGFLSQVTDPLAKSATFTNSSTGLLISRTDENGNISNYNYDGQGGLAKDADPVGGYTALTRTNGNSGFGWTVAQTTSMGRTSSFQSTLTMPWVENNTSAHTEQKTITWPNGLQATKSTPCKMGNSPTHLHCPMAPQTVRLEVLILSGEFRFQSIPVKLSTRGNLTMNITGSRSTTLGHGRQSVHRVLRDDTQTINGRTYTSVFTGSSKTYVDTTPVKRKTTTILDSLERISSYAGRRSTGRQVRL